MARRAAVVVILVALAAAGCGQREAEGPTEGAPQWTVKGSIVSVEAAEKRVSIDHQDIPGLMAAMTMAFPVEDTQLLEGLGAGDAVEFVLTRKSSGLTITEIKKIDPLMLLDESAVGKSWDGQGTVLFVNRTAAAVQLKHEGVRGLMPAAEMNLSATPPSLLDGIEDNTEVEFTLTNTERGLVLTGLKKREKE